MRQFLERKTIYHSYFWQTYQLLPDCNCCSGVGPNGEPMWGHVYISGETVSYDFRAKFGGKYDCNLEGSYVVDLGIGCDLLEDVQDVQEDLS